jgi:hypothetical protein
MDTKLAKNVQKYIELVYSEKSDLNAIPNLEERKKKACDQAGLKYEESQVQNIIHMKNNDVNAMIFEFCESQNSNEFMLYISNQHFFWEQMQLLMEPLKKISEEGKTLEIDDEAMMKRTNMKNTVSKNCKELLERINEGRMLIYKGEEEADKASEKIRIMRPEERLKKKAG